MGIGGLLRPCARRRQIARADAPASRREAPRGAEHAVTRSTSSGRQRCTRPRPPSETGSLHASGCLCEPPLLNHTLHWYYGTCTINAVRQQLRRGSRHSKQSPQPPQQCKPSRDFRPPQPPRPTLPLQIDLSESRQPAVQGTPRVRQYARAQRRSSHRRSVTTSYLSETSLEIKLRSRAGGFCTHSSAASQIHPVLSPLRVSRRVNCAPKQQAISHPTSNITGSQVVVRVACIPTINAVATHRRFLTLASLSMLLRFNAPVLHSCASGVAVPTNHPGIDRPEDREALGDDLRCGAVEHNGVRAAARQGGEQRDGVGEGFTGPDCRDGVLQCEGQPERLLQ